MLFSHIQSSSCFYALALILQHQGSYFKHLSRLK